MEIGFALGFPQGKGRGLGHHCAWDLPFGMAAGPHLRNHCLCPEALAAGPDASQLDITL